jgi:hypothetical protein
LPFFNSATMLQPQCPQMMSLVTGQIDLVVELMGGKLGTPLPLEPGPHAI